MWALILVKAGAQRRIMPLATIKGRAQVSAWYRGGAHEQGRYKPMASLRKILYSLNILGDCLDRFLGEARVQSGRFYWALAARS
jgi:hypothetical protein